MRLYPILGLLVTIISSCRMTLKNGAQESKLKVDLSQYPEARYPVQQGDKWGYVNNRLELVIPASFDDAQDFSDGLAGVGERLGNTTMLLYGFIDANGKKRVENKYEKVYPFEEGLAAVMKDGRYGFIDSSGKEVIALQYEEVASFSEGTAVVKVNGKNGFINKKGAMLIAPSYNRACWVSSFKEGLAPVYVNDNAGGYIDTHGKLVIPAKFSYVSAFSQGLALVQPLGSNKYGFINRKGEFVIEATYELSLPFTEGLASMKTIRKDGSTVFRIIDTSGNVVADDLQYAFVGIFQDGLAGVESYDHRWGFIDKSGKEVIPPKFSSVRLFNNGLSKVETGSLFGGLQTNYIDKQGTMVFKQ